MFLKVRLADVPDVCEPNCDGMCRTIGYCPRRRQRLRVRAKETGAEPEKEKSDETEDGDTNNGRSR